MDVRDVDIETVFGIIVGQQTGVLEFPAENCRGLLVVMYERLERKHEDALRMLDTEQGKQGALTIDDEYESLGF